MLFGTYSNPREDIEECGFPEKVENKMLAMLATKDLTQEINDKLQGELSGKASLRLCMKNGLVY